MKGKLVGGILIGGTVAALLAIVAGLSGSGGGHVVGGLPAAFGVLVAAGIGAVTVLAAIVVALLPIGSRGQEQEQERERDQEREGE